MCEPMLPSPRKAMFMAVLDAPNGFQVSTPYGALRRRGVLEGEFGIARLLNLDKQCDSALQAAKRKFFAGVLARYFVHDLELRVVTKFDHTSANLHFLVWIVKIDHRQGEARIASQIP